MNRHAECALLFARLAMKLRAEVVNMTFEYRGMDVQICLVVGTWQILLPRVSGFSCLS